MAGRIRSYLHSTGLVPDKAGCLVRVTSDTDFATRTKEFANFADRVAQLACGFQTDNWDELIIHMPALKEELINIQNLLRENVRVDKIILLSLD